MHSHTYVCMYVDTNECEEGLYNCTQFCVNDPGSYHCECDITEYVLLSDGITCESELSTWISSCPYLAWEWLCNRMMNSFLLKE